MGELAMTWAAVRAALRLLPGWDVAEPVYEEDLGVWIVRAGDTRSATGGAHRRAIEASGATEVEALWALVELLRAI